MKVTEMWSSRCKERSEEAYDEQETRRESLCGVFKGCVFFVRHGTMS